ncbi:MAG: AMIN domain-containing protein [Gemmatimonadetes bacterium]|nr:AMIN domain-containing protein [Gemmatimonadota bacterium]
MIRSLAVLSLLPLLLGAAPLPPAPPGQVVGLYLEPRGDRAELTIQIEGGSVEWTDFTLAGPPRVVLDIQGARNALPESRYEGIYRGGIVALRTSQHLEDVVRLVIDLDLSSRYIVSQVPEGIRVSFSSGAAAFQPWSSNGGRAARPAPATAAASSPPVRQVQQEGRRITVTFQNADIRDVLSAFAEFTGRSIVPGAGVTGTVTAEIRDQPWDIALRTILQAYGLAAVELPSGIIRVDAIERLREREVQEPLVTQSFRVNYVPAAELVTTLTGLSSERGNLVANPSTNTLIVTDIEGVVTNIGAMVRQLDIRTPQVSIQAKIIFVNRTDVEELGIVYDIKDSRGNQLNRVFPGFNPATGEEVEVGTDLILLGGNSIAALGNASTRVTGAQLQTIVSLVLGRHTLITFLEALQSAQLSDVQAAPVITTLDNQEAEIWVGERTPIRVIDVGQAGGGPGAGGQTRATAQLVETGIRLRVTPHITADRRILMQLHAERSSAQPAAGDIGVVFQTQQGTTRLLVADGETAVIGGLTVSEVASSRTGIPFLMEIPYLGALFRTSRSQEQKRDLLIMVTPHIVDDRS